MDFTDEESTVAAVESSIATYIRMCQESLDTAGNNNSISNHHQQNSRTSPLLSNSDDSNNNRRNLFHSEESHLGKGPGITHHRADSQKSDSSSGGKKGSTDNSFVPPAGCYLKSSEDGRDDQRKRKRKHEDLGNSQCYADVDGCEELNWKLPGTPRKEHCSSYANSSDEDDESTGKAGSVGEIESIAMESFPTDVLSTGSITTSGSLTIGSLALISLASADKAQQQNGNNSIVHESLTTNIVYVCDSKRKYNTKTGYIAIKMLVDQYPSPNQISRLENEYKVSRHLSKCVSIRPALEVITNEDGFHAIYLEWAEGITLRDWIRSVHRTEDEASSNNFDYERAVHLALEIAKALEEIHEYDVVHNNLTTDNIIVCVNKENDSFSVKIIDLGIASILKDKDNDSCRGRKQKDVTSLGAVFYELFTGKNPFVAENDGKDHMLDHQRGNNNNRQLRQDLFSRTKASLPVCLSTLIMKLNKKIGREYFYQSSSKVVLDLQSMLSNHRQFLLGTEGGKKVGQLHFKKDKLYGRVCHLRALMDAFSRVSQPGGTSEMVLISGYSGAGKSALVQQFRQILSTKNANILCGKFDQFQQMGEPLSAIIDAFTEYCKQLAAKDDEHMQKTRAAIKEALGSESGVLENLIPTLREITGAPITDIFHAGSVEAQNRLKYVFRLFVRAIASQTHPLVLCLDDLQWIDDASLKLITSLVTDRKNTSLLLIGLYRENEVTAEHPLNKQLEYIKSQVKGVNKIAIDNLGKKEVNELISDTLDMPSDSTQPLTDVVYRKTSGNMLFLLQFMRSLCDEGLISFSFDTQQWQWDTEAINSKHITDDTVGLMSRKILSFPKEAQSALKVMSCLGTISEEMVQCLIVGKNVGKENAKSVQCFNICRDHRNLLQWLEFSVNEGLLDHTSSGYNFDQDQIKEGLIDHEGSSFKFAHDQIQLAAYSLIPENERGLWHLQLGIQLWANKTVALEKRIFTAVGQLNQGISFVEDKYHREEIANLNLQAGEKAISLAVYPLAASFLEAGINMLGDKCWEETYDISLKIYVSYAEVCYCNGSFEKMNKALDVIFTFARCFRDKCQAYFTQVRALGAQTKVHEAIKVGLFTLENLGERFPTFPDKRAINAEFSKTKKMLGDKSDTDILELCKAKEKQKIAAMQLLSILILICSSTTKTRSKYPPLFSFRLVQLSLKYGLCGDSAFGFACLGYALRGLFQDIKGSYYYGQVALRLVERFKLKNYMVHVSLSVLVGINSWVERHHACIEPLKRAYKIGMSCGETQSALGCATHYCIALFQCGEKLEAVEKAMKVYGDEMLEHKQEMFWGKLQIWRQTTLNLMGRCKDPLKLVGEAMDQEPFLKDSLQYKQKANALAIYYNFSMLAYLFGDYELASKMAAKGQVEIDASIASGFQQTNHVFFRGLISLVLARSSGQTTSQSIADKSIERMKNWSEYAPSNFQHKLLLLQAEYAFLLGKGKDAAKKYDMAIDLAEKNGFIHEKAIALELAGIFYKDQGNVSKATQLYGQAHDAYLQWGAKGKADHLRLNYPF